MNAQLDSRIFGHLWSTDEIRALFSDEGRTQSWLEILAALAEAQATVGLIPAEAAAAISSHADVRLLDLDRVAELTRQSSHSTHGLIHELMRILPAGAREWVYYGATVQDLSDTWMALVGRRVNIVVRRDLEAIRERVLELADVHRFSVMSGRSHGQVGLPITFGFKAAVWAAEIGRHLTRLDELAQRFEVVQLGGALGTMEFWGRDALPLKEEFARRLWLGNPAISWLTARDNVAEFLGVLSMVAGTLAKIGNEVYQLQRSEVGELSEAMQAGRVGSITMPHKQNPELSEHLSTLSRLVRTNASLAQEGLVHDHERDGRAWKTEWVIFPESCMYVTKASSVARDLVVGLVVHEDRMRTNLEQQRGYPMSERVMLALSGRLGKHSAHEAMYDATMAGQKRGMDLLSALLESPVVMKAITRAELQDLMDLDAIRAPLETLIDAVLEAR